MDDSTHEEPDTPAENAVSQEPELPEGKTPSDTVDEGIARAIDWASLRSVLTRSLSFADQFAGVAGNEKLGNKAAELAEEITGGLREIAHRMKTIEDTQTQLVTRSDRLEQSLHDTSRAIARELAKLENELLGERKAFLARSVFDSVVATLDSLRPMHDALSSKKSRRMYIQLSAVEMSLRNILRGLGFQEFNAQEGEPFDPSRMECLGYMEGQRGIVVNAVRPGYTAGNTVIRPAGVLIADPRKT